MKNKKRKLIAALLGILMILSSTVSAFAASVTVTYSGSIFSYYSNGGKPTENLHGTFVTSEGSIAYCAEHGIHSPMGEKIGNSVVLDKQIYEDTQIRKILYYGWKGPKEWAGFHDPAYNKVYQINFAGNISKDKALSCGISVTSMALTKAYGVSGRVYNISGLTAFENYIFSMPDPGSNEFVTYLLPSPNSYTQDLFTWEYNPEPPKPQNGYLNLVKTSAEPVPYSLAGADYGVYTSISLSGDSYVGTLTTDSSGNTNILELEPGTYYVKEIKAPVGYDLDSTTYTAKVVSEKTITIYSKENPSKGYFKLHKTTKNNSSLIKLCPENYTLEGAIYGVYKCYSDAENKVNEVNTLVTDKSGDSNTVTLLTGKYYVREILSPKGYKKDQTIYSIEVKRNKTEVLRCADEPYFDPLTLKIVKKATEETDKNLSVEGAIYSIKYFKKYLNEEQVKDEKAFRTWHFRTDKKGIILVNEEWKVGGDNLFKTESGSTVGLHGTYVVEEVEAPKGFAKTEGILSIQHVRHNQKYDTVTVLKDVTDIEKPQTISITINKVDAETGKNEPQGYGTLADAKYDVFFFDPVKADDVKVATLTTDEKGFARYEGGKPGLYKVVETKASKGYIVDKEYKEVKARIKEVNTANFDYVVTSKEKPINVEIEKTSIDEKGSKITVAGAKLQLLDNEKNVIETFTSTDKKHIIKGLKPGKYYIREVEAPNGYFSMEDDYVFDVKDEEKPQKIEIFNEPKPEIKTTATVNGNKNVKLDKEIMVTDIFEYSKLMKNNQYIVKGKVIDKATGEAIASSEKIFTPNTSNGKIKVEFIFDGRKYTEGGAFVVTEKLYRLCKDGTERLVAEHEDISDLNQTINIPTLKTTATDRFDDGKDLNASEKQTIVDKVEYSNLYLGKEYTIRGILMNKTTGKPVLVDGEKVTAEKVFTAKSTSSFVELEFTFDSSALKGETIVVFETLYENKVEVAAHADINDKNQAIYIPEIKTTASSMNDGYKQLLPINAVVISDKVEYKNLIKGQRYELRGSLINTNNNEILVKASDCFVAENTDGCETLDFEIDATNLKGKDIVVFEELVKIDENGDKIKVVAKHADINDKGQTVRIVNPKIKTTATFADGKKENSASENLTIIDKIMYRDFVQDKKYTIKGILMNKNTGKPYITSEGEVITTEKSFIAENNVGIAEVEFDFNAEVKADTELVVFQEIYYEGQLIATHSDINDTEQTVAIAKPQDQVPTGDEQKPIELLFILILCVYFFFKKSKKVLAKRYENVIY